MGLITVIVMVLMCLVVFLAYCVRSINIKLV